MMLWNRKNHDTVKDEIIDKYQRKEQEYRLELEQKNKLILQYIEKELAYQRDQNKDKQSIQELQQKVAEYEQRVEHVLDSKSKQQLIEDLQQKIAEFKQQEAEYVVDLKGKQQLMEDLQQKVVEYEQKETEYKRRLSSLEKNMQNMHSLPRKLPEMVQTEGHFKTMDRIAKKLSNGQASSTSLHKGQTFSANRATQRPRSSYSSQPPQTMQFNPFKNSQGR